MNWIDYRNRILTTVDNEAFFTNELTNIQRRGVEFKAACPYTDMHKGGVDNSPSLTVNVSSGVYFCQTCRSKGNVHTLLMKKYHIDSEEAWFTLGDNLDIERPDSAKPDRPPINQALAADYHTQLMAMSDTAPIRKVLKELRGFTDETLKDSLIGWDRQKMRITIPIYDEYNELVNIRLYKWDAESGAEKMKNYVDEFENAYGEVRIDGIEDLLDDSVEEIIWCEGETDRRILKQNGFHVCTPTSGTGSFRPEWKKLFKNKKKVYILQDNDAPGERGAAAIAEQLYRLAPVFLPKWPEGFMEKGDPTDFFVKSKRTAQDFQYMLDTAPQYKVTVVDHSKDEIVDVSLAASSNFEMIGKRQRIPIMVSGKDTAPYVAPRRVKILCDPSGKGCEYCENAAFGGEQIIEFTAAMPETINLIQCTTQQQKETIKDVAKISHKCTRFTVEILEYMNLEELRAIPQAETNFAFAKEHEYVVRKCYYIGKNLKTNQRYAMVGFSHAEPKTQYVTHIFDDAVPAKDRVTSFEVTPELVEELKMFQPNKGQSIMDKFEEIHKDLERNVTYVWERRDVGIGVDLIYHTALSFYFQEQFIRKGWAELLILGDSGQAKSTLVERMMKHYQLGEFYSGESSRRTGLVYSFQQTQKRWFLIWGAWPLNDGGLVVIDEFSGISEEELSMMSDVRSSGIARATGVITAETNARTRAIYMSNPRNGRQLNTETHGVQAVLKLLGKAEDVRRLDLVVGVASGDIDDTLINRSIKDFSKVSHTYNTEACKNRVLWCWSRRPQDISFEIDAEEQILKDAVKMGRKYSSQIPIVEPADQRLKIARLSIAAAGCMFSSPDGKTLVVKKEHVEFVVAYMNKVYDSKNLDYKGYSESTHVELDVTDDRITMLRKKFALLPVNVNELATTLYDMQYFRRTELQDSTGLENDDLLKVMSFLNINKIIERTMNGYRKLPNGIKLLKTIMDEPITQEEIKAIHKQAYKSSEY